MNFHLLWEWFSADDIKNNNLYVKDCKILVHFLSQVGSLEAPGLLSAAAPSTLCITKNERIYETDEM